MLLGLGLGLGLSPWSAFGQIVDDGRLARATLVIYNSEDPVSRQLATYYGRRRAIPAGQVMGISMPQKLTVNREEYREQIEKPIRREFFRNRWWRMEGDKITGGKIRFVVLMHGVPLKIKQHMSTEGLTEEQKQNPFSFRDEASVDSELAAMGFLAAPDVGALKNFYFRSFKPISQAGIPPLLLVTRLDAPNAQTVKRMIDGALRAEETGLYGWAVVDSRGINKGGYKQGDDWLNEIAEDLRFQNDPTIVHPGGEVLATFPFHDVAFYFGWYTGNATPNFLAPDHKVFRPGAIAVHIHSYSAGSISVNRHWVGPLLENGAAVTLGNVYEPYLGLTNHLDMFYDRLKSGMTVAEAAYAAQPVLSWMAVVFGDPIYRPFKVDQDIFSKPSLNGDDLVWFRGKEAYKILMKQGPEAGSALFKELQVENALSPVPLLLNAQALLKRDSPEQAARLLSALYRFIDDAAARGHAIRLLAQAYDKSAQTDALKELLLSEYATHPKGPYLGDLKKLAKIYDVALPIPTPAQQETAATEQTAGSDP